MEPSADTVLASTGGTGMVCPSIWTTLEFQMSLGTPHWLTASLRHGMPRPSLLGSSPVWSFPHRWIVSVPLVPIGSCGDPAVRAPSFSIRMLDAQKSMTASEKWSVPPLRIHTLVYWYVPAFTWHGLVITRSTPIFDGGCSVPLRQPSGLCACAASLWNAPAATTSARAQAVMIERVMCGSP
jgi:hypothetical protein